MVAALDVGLQAGTVNERESLEGDMILDHHKGMIGGMGAESREIMGTRDGKLGLRRKGMVRVIERGRGKVRGRSMMRV